VDLTVAAARRELAAGRLSALELTQQVLARVEALNPRLNAYLHVDAEGALAQARAADASKGSDPSRALHGIPVCVKDVFDVRGMPTTAGAAGWRHDPARDAAAVARLREAGAIVVGKGNTNEFAYGIDGANPHRGDCRNPIDPERLAGGSSSGPAAATAAGMALAGLGTDTTGSLRVPASLCGLVGVRPTLGRVPVDGLVPLAWSYDVAGPLARTVEDAAIVLGVLLGEEPRPAPAVRGRRVGVVEGLLEGVEPYVADGVAAAAARLRALGVEVEPVRIDLFRHATAMHRIVQESEAAAVHAPWFDDQRERYAEPVRRRLEAGRLVPTTAYLDAQRARRLLLAEVAEAMAGLDALLAPATPLVAPRLDEARLTVAGESLDRRVALLRCVLPLSQLGSPVVSVPIGAHDGLPFGLQVAGRPFAEAMVLAIAQAAERARAT
jgi:aspartyl-tRNA(Asn)/glutamyl-tRNA(Gln) amidotransferase subunit A